VQDPEQHVYSVEGTPVWERLLMDCMSVKNCQTSILETIKGLQRKVAAAGPAAVGVDSDDDW
jgi:hypothetical protein